MKYKYLDENFVGEMAKNVIIDRWGMSEKDFDRKVLMYEDIGMGVIKASINIDKLKEDAEGMNVLKGMLTTYATAKLYEQIGFVDYIDLAEQLMRDFKYTIANIREAQRESGIKADEKKVVSGIVIC